MDIVIGLAYPAGKDAPPVLSLLRRLDFADARYELAHVIAPPIPAGWPAEVLVAAEALAFQQDQESARALTHLQHLAPQLTDQLGAVTTTILDGSPAESLLRHAHEKGAELIAADGSERGAFERALVGSVARALVIGARESVLLARPSTSSGPVKAVFATDHSDYADRCAHLLARYAPRGIAELTIVAAYPEERLNALEPLAGHLGVSPAEAMREALKVRNARLEATLAGVAPTVRSLVVPGEPNDAIAQSLEEAGAELLILGARGHGFVERVTMGSVSLHQAMRAKTSVLVLRA